MLDFVCLTIQLQVKRLPPPSCVFSALTLIGVKMLFWFYLESGLCRSRIEFMVNGFLPGLGTTGASCSFLLSEYIADCRQILSLGNLRRGAFARSRIGLFEDTFFWSRRSSRWRGIRVVFNLFTIANWSTGSGHVNVTLLSICRIKSCFEQFSTHLVTALVVSILSIHCIIDKRFSVARHG